MSDTTASSEDRSDTGHRTTCSTAQPAHAQTPTTPREHIVEFTDEGGTRRRLRYVPRTEDWWRIEDQWTGCCWRVVGRELVEDFQYWSRPVTGETND